MPVELTFFKGEATEKGDVLKWQTALEQNKEGFYLEKSTDAQEWKTIGFIIGNGSTSEMTNYEFLDDEPSNGQNYYRLQQIDYDGKQEYSKMLKPN